MDFGFNSDWALANEPIDSLVDKDDPDYKQWLAKYLQSEKEAVISLQQALEKNDYQKIAYISDMMYGHGTSVGFPLVSLVGKAIVLAAQAKKDSEISSLIAYLNKYLDFLSGNE
jgi:HPt (histidine-containing phosphotransfer) domain-containing protein